MVRKPRILFLGGFSVGQDGTEGGQVFACRSLVASPISEWVEWKLVDSTQRSLPPPPIWIRAWDASRRLFRCGWHLLFSRVDTVLVFTNFSVLSLAEKGLVLILGRLLGKHVVVSFRFHPHLPRRGQFWYRLYLKQVCRATRRIICQSHLAAAELVKLVDVPSEKIEIVHNWIDTRRFATSGLAADKPRDRADALVQLIYVGWMHPKKGVQFLMPAIHLLAQRRRDFRLILCGAGDLLESMQNSARELGIEPFVEFRGWVKNEVVNQLLNEADIFVLPSLAEGMPNSLLQAMACGLPVVTTNVSSIPAIVTDGLNGRLIEPGSAAAICEALDDLIADPQRRAQMGAVNRKQILAQDILVVWPRLAQILEVPLPSPVRAGAEPLESSR